MERKGRERKPRLARASSQPEDSVDPELEEFEEVDLTAVAPSVVETTAEAIEGLASSEEFRALAERRSQDADERITARETGKAVNTAHVAPYGKPLALIVPA